MVLYSSSLTRLGYFWDARGVTAFAVSFTLVYNTFWHCDLRWPLCVARSEGGYLLTYFAVNAGNVVRYPTLRAFVNVMRVGENRDAW